MVALIHPLSANAIMRGSIDNALSTTCCHFVAEKSSITG